MFHFPEPDIVIGCLRNSNVWDSINFGGNKNWKQIVLNYFSDEFFRRSMWIGAIRRGVSVIVRDLFANWDQQFIQLSRSEVQKSLERAVLLCSYQSDPIGRPSTSNDPNINRLPYFGWENNLLRELLDLILVIWRVLPSQMLSTPYRIATVQSFVERALELMESIYEIYGDDFDLDEELMSLFFCRSSFFFDAYDELNPYVEHTYSLDHKKPYVQGDIRKYLKRMALVNRNRILPRSYVERFLRIYVIDPRSDGTEYDYYSQYNGGINAIINYYESKRTFFARVILAIVELLRSLSLTYGDRSVQDDEIVDKIAEKVIKILSDDDYYSQYLLEEKWKEILKNSDGNVFVKRLKQNRRVSVFHLIMSIWKHIKNSIKRVATTTTTTSTTTTTASSVSSTPEYEESSRGKEYIKRVGSKCYPMNDKRNSDNNEENSGPSCPKRSKYSERSRKTTDKFYDYLMDESNEEHFFLESLQDTFSSIFKSEMCIDEGLTSYG